MPGKAVDLIVRILTDATQADAGVQEALTGYEKFAGTINKLVVPAFLGLVGALGIGFLSFKAVASQSEELAAEWEELVKAVLSIGIAIGEALLPVMLPLINFLTDAAEWVAKNADWIAILVVVVGALSGAILILNVALKAYELITGIVTVATKLFNKALMMNPIGLVIGLVLALVAAIVWLWNNVEGFRDFWIEVWENIKQAVQDVVDWFVEAWEAAMAAVQKVLEFLYDHFVETMYNMTHPVQALIGKFEKLISTVKSVIDWIAQIRMPDLSGLAVVGGSVGVTTTATTAAATSTASARVPRRTRDERPTVNITVNGALDPNAVAKQIAGILGVREARLGLSAAAGVRR